MCSDRVVISETIVKDIPKMYSISRYLSPSGDNNLDLVSRTLVRLRGSNIIIGLDTNAHSTTWGSPITNAEGEAIEVFMTQQNLKLLNVHTNVTTFCSSKGSSNIDVALTKGQIMHRVHNWLVEDGWTLSDHRVITFNINSQITHAEHAPFNQPGYETRLRSYDNFNNNNLK